MNLKAFLDQYNHNNVVILLEGKRNVPDNESMALQEVSKLLAKELPLAHFRSGNAKGADEFFARGICAVEPTRFHVVIPFSNHRVRNRINIKSHCVEDFAPVFGEALIKATRNHAPTSHLVDLYLQGIRDRSTIKVSYIMRNSLKVLGHQHIPPTTVALFYDDLNNPEDGGTGFTIRACRENNIPLFKQDVWMNWL